MNSSLLQTEREFLNDLWEDLACRCFPVPVRLPGPVSLRQSEWVPEFIELMHNRLVQGAFRYGLMATQDFSKYDLPQAIRDRIALYDQDHNLEHLVDAGNICMITFLHGQRLGQVMKSIDDGIHNEKAT